MSCAKCRDGLRQMASGTHSRREVLLGAVALGLSSGAVGAVPVRAQDASTMPPYIPRPDSEILLPIAEPLTEEKVTFSLLSVHNPEVTDYDDNRFTEWLEEKTNVHIEWQLVSEEEAATELNLILASGDIPEIIFGIVTPSQEAHYGAQGLFLPLNDLIEEHAPRLKRIFEVYPAAKAALTAPDGNIYSMPFLEDCYHCTMSQKLWIYQPWLDTLGLEMPTTTDEFEQVLLAFKEQDPNGNGQADEIPLSTTMSEEGWQNRLDLFFMNSFIYNPGQENPGGPWLILRDGRVTPVYNTPEWKEGLKYLQRLYSQGLIDPQSFTQDIDGLQRLGNNPDEVILGSVPAGYMGVFIAARGDAGRPLYGLCRRAAAGRPAGRPLRWLDSHHRLPGRGDHQRLRRSGISGALDRQPLWAGSDAAPVPGRAGRGLALGRGGRVGPRRPAGYLEAPRRSC